MSSSIENLTEDTLTDIFTRLPIKSIGLSRCVCKPWLTLLTNPRFIKLHFKQSSLKNPNLLVKTHNPFNPSNIFQTLDTNLLDEFVNINLVDLPPWTELEVVGSCNGLVCIWDCRNYISILNPSTRELIELPPYPFYTDAIMKPKVMGFGFNIQTEEYKVVTVSHLKDNNGVKTPFSMVYTLGENSWRTVDISSLPPSYITTSDHSIYLNGNLHWVGSRGSVKDRSITVFDLRNENFGELPWFDYNQGHYGVPRLKVWEGCLATFCYFFDSIGIWKMMDYGAMGYWVKVLSIVKPLKWLRPLVLLKNGDVLLQVGDEQVRLYDPVNAYITSPVIRGARRTYNACTYYVESLTSIKSLIQEKQGKRRVLPPALHVPSTSEL